MRTILGLVTIMALWSASAHAAAGDLDPSFGDGGFQLIAIGSDSYPHGLARQPDGKLLAVGETGFSSVALTRSLPTGQLDTTFSGDGMHVISDGAATLEGRAVLVQASGRIVVVARRSSAVALYGFLPSGSPDGAFGLGGSTVTPVAPTGGFNITGMLQPDGKIVVIGDSTNASSNGVPYVVRYDAGGTLDPTFGAGGVTMLDFPGDPDRVASVAVEPGGGIVVGGFSGDFTSATGYVVRVDAGGVVDGTYGTAGVATLGIPSSHFVQRLLALPDGRLIVGGLQLLEGFLVRLDASGDVDPAFGVAGLRPVEYGGFNGGVGSLGLDPQGRIVAAGYHNDYAHRSSFGIGRYSVDGVPDATFGSGGTARIALPDSDMSDAEGIVFEPDGTITLAGGYFLINELDDSRTAFALARVQATGPACTSDADCPLCQSCGAGVCTHAPRTTCAGATARRASVKWRIDPNRVTRSSLTFQWRGARMAGTFDPLAGDDAAVCFYVGTASHRSLVGIFPGGPCPSGTCWQAAGATSKYRDRSRADGLQLLKLSATKARLKGKGPGLYERVPVPTPFGEPDPPPPPLRIQVQVEGEQCAEATFQTFVVSEDETKLKARN